MGERGGLRRKWVQWKQDLKDDLSVPNPGVPWFRSSASEKKRVADIKAAKAKKEAEDPIGTADAARKRAEDIYLDAVDAFNESLRKHYGGNKVGYSLTSPPKAFSACEFGVKLFFPKDKKTQKAHLHVLAMNGLYIAKANGAEKHAKFFKKKLRKLENPPISTKVVDVFKRFSKN